jgi:hypothetical protein
MQPTDGIVIWRGWDSKEGLGTLRVNAKAGRQARLTEIARERVSRGICGDTEADAAIQEGNQHV